MNAPEPTEYERAIAGAMPPHLPEGWSVRAVPHRIDHAVMFCCGNARGHFRRKIQVGLDSLDDLQKAGERPEVGVEIAKRQGIFEQIRNDGDVRDDTPLLVRLRPS